VRARTILLVGPTGSGKTPLGALLERKGLCGRRCRHFDFGAELRRAAASPSPPGFTAADLGVIRRSLETGALFEDSEFPVAVKIFRRFAASARAGRGGLIVLNGFPRHAGQARDLDDLIAVEGVVLLEAGAEVVAERIRRDTEGDRRCRRDDSPDGIRKKVETFRERTLPLVAHYAAQGAWVARIEVAADSTAADHYGVLSERCGGAA